MVKSIRIKSEDILSDNFFTLKEVYFELGKDDGSTQQQKREVYHTANGVTVLLYNKEKKAVLLTRQLRIASFLNNNTTGLLIETCAGIQEDESACDSVLREIEEETGFRVSNAKKIFELYSSPGSNTEMLHYFIAEYSDKQKVSEGGGLEEEQEDIEVIEMPFNEAYKKIESGEIKDAKTVILLQYAKASNLFPEENVFALL
jgi:nudix-type nucleoside diphosphatase (YffH/AdpP family)